MRWDQYTNVLQLAAALSMAGWVARPSDNAQDYPVDFNQQYNNLPSSRYHPYSSYNNGEFAAQPGYGPMVQDTMVPDRFQPQYRESLHQSKDAEETFRAYLELQELISLQGSYRRGDLPIGRSNQQFVLPVVNNNGDKISERGQARSDDGYMSGEASIGSPASSVISGISSTIDDVLSSATSPSPDSVFDGNNDDFQLLATPGSQFSSSEFTTPPANFDIDDILYDEKSVKKEEDFSSDFKGPFSKLISTLDDDLEYVNSPLKSPGTDSFLTRLSPEYNPPSPVRKNKFDDPFQMEFTNSSIPDKFLSETMLEMGEFDPSYFESTGLNDEEMDKALVQSLASSEKLDAATTVSIKTEEDYSFVDSPIGEHNYFKEDYSANYFASKPISRFNNTIRSDNFQRPVSTPSPNRNGRGRTFAPSAQQLKHRTQPKLKEQKHKPTLMWNDFPYTSDQLVTMPVETFNEVIKQLDEIRQHVAKDLRRKGKNKLAARNCRKRKMEVIEDLDTGIGTLEDQRNKLMAERQKLLEETRHIRQKTEWLNNYIFEHLRDSNGIPYTSNDFSLQYTSDGNVYLVPSGQMKAQRTLP